VRSSGSDRSIVSLARHHGRTDAGRRHSVRRDIVCRRSARRESEVRMLQVPRQPVRAECDDRRVRWKSYTIPEEPKPVRKNAQDVQLWGPSGAGVWSSPAVDLKGGAVYITTGDAYSRSGRKHVGRVHGVRHQDRASCSGRDR
jgi:hypothetical protein